MKISFDCKIVNANCVLGEISKKTQSVKFFFFRNFLCRPLLFGACGYVGTWAAAMKTSFGCKLFNADCVLGEISKIQKVEVSFPKLLV